MSNLLEAIQEDARKALEKNQGLESRGRSLEVQNAAAKKVLADHQAGIRQLEDRKKNLFTEVMNTRKDIVAEMDKQRAETTRLHALVQEERKAVSAERIQLEREKDALSKDKVKNAKLEKGLTNKFSRLQSVLNEAI